MSAEKLSSFDDTTVYLDREYFCLEKSFHHHEETACLASNGERFGKDKNNFSYPQEIAAEDLFC